MSRVKDIGVKHAANDLRKREESVTPSDLPDSHISTGLKMGEVSKLHTDYTGYVRKKH